MEMFLTNGLGTMWMGNVWRKNKRRSYLNHTGDSVQRIRSTSLSKRRGRKKRLNLERFEAQYSLSRRSLHISNLSLSSIQNILEQW